MTDFSPDKLRQRFAKLTKESEAIAAKSAPLRAKRDKHVQAARAKEDELNAEIKKVESGLFKIEQERAVIARALGGKTAITGG